MFKTSSTLKISLNIPRDIHPADHRLEDIMMLCVIKVCNMWQAAFTNHVYTSNLLQNKEQNEGIYKSRKFYVANFINRELQVI